MSNSKSERIAFLSNNFIITKPLFNWLNAQGEHVILYENKIDASYIIENNVSFVISYNYLHMIQQDVLDLLPHRAVNLHISLLPWNRGFDPNIWSFIENTPCGVTIHEIDKSLDTGDILLQQSVVFDTTVETLKTSYMKLHQVIQELFILNWQDLKANRITPWQQKEQGSYHRKKDLDPYRNQLDFNELICVLMQKIEIL